MQCWNCGSKEVKYIGSVYPGDYPFECPECGIYIDGVEWEGVCAGAHCERCARCGPLGIDAHKYDYLDFEDANG